LENELVFTKQNAELVARQNQHLEVNL